MDVANVLSYFLVILGGFGAVWAFRYLAGQKEEKISEFEYAAFSTIWGIPIFAIYVSATQDHPEMLQRTLELPMIATPVLFLLGAFLGGLAGVLYKVCVPEISNFLKKNSIFGR